MASRFSQDISAFVKKTGLRADTVLRKVALDAFAGLIRRSPVDTGRFRASWRVGINSVDPSVESPRTKSGFAGKGFATVRTGTPGASGNEVAQAQSKLSTVRFGQSVHLSNNLPYAEVLESGSSQQAPSGVLKLTFEEVKASLGRTVASIKD